MKAKKSLGQHFIASRSAIAEIVRVAEISSGETVLEIGPGKGILTEALLKTGAKVVAIEKDDQLAVFLKEKFSPEIASGRLNLFVGDILELEIESLKIKAGNYKLVANIPYYITGEILRKFIGGEVKPSLAVLLVQKEVAERIVARDKKESVLSISVKIYGEPKIVKKVPAGAFNPPPKVDSAILLIKNIKNNFSGKDEGTFFKILKAGFAHKRKFLSGNLSKLFPQEKIFAALAGCGIKEKIRAEDLTPKDWLCLSEKIKTYEVPIREINP